MSANFKNDKYEGYILSHAEVNDNEGIRIRNNEKVLLELLVSRTTLSVDTNTLTNENVHEWLWYTGKAIADKLKEPKQIKLYYRDINGNEIVGDINSLEQKNI